ncbi:MAG: DNA mismatch repair protein MutS [Gammaproteobacteria bacterium]|mgnify:CR=1 FL=1|nr:MAG: DNA mismatch repair protein MutS [Gammaproteobacteria bacterium]
MSNKNTDFDLFQQEMSGIKKIDSNNVKESAKPKPKPIPRSQIQDDRDVISQLDSDPFSHEYIETGDEIFFFRPGLQQKVIRKLKRGQFAIERELDLHGMTAEQAKNAINSFFHDCNLNSDRCVLVIHGKGYRTEEREPVLKSMLNGWLRHRSDVLGFCSARIEDGGTGAIYVLLRNA